MTKAELIEALRSVPDEAQIVFEDSQLGFFTPIEALPVLRNSDPPFWQLKSGNVDG